MGNLKEDEIIKNDEEKIRDFQEKLYQKAKQEKEFRFYILHDKINSTRFLREAFKRVKKNRGSCGIDGVTFEKIDEYGEEEYLQEISDELRMCTYKPQGVKRVYIPKANGKMRPLGIPTIKDRIVQMSCKLVIEPIFEADFEETSYGFRPERAAKDAIRQIKENLKEGNVEIYDADLSSYFDTIPHDKLMTLVGKRISDLQVLRLIKMWLKAPIIEENDDTVGRGRKNEKGTPQGGVISPLLANIYLNLLDKQINEGKGKYSEFRKAGIKIVRYADDFVLMGKELKDHTLETLEEIINRMGLLINKEKSKKVKAREESFNFLGFTMRYDKDLWKEGKYYWNIIPSEKAQIKIRESLKETLEENRACNPKDLSAAINKRLRGWLNYYSIEGVSYPNKAKRNLRYYLMQKLYRYYKKKSQRKCKLYRKGAFNELVEKHGLINPYTYNLKVL